MPSYAPGTAEANVAGVEWARAQIEGRKTNGVGVEGRSLRAL